MKKIILVIAMSLVSLAFYAQNRITKNVIVDSPGWKRVVKLSNSVGRGYNEVVISTRGGARRPTVSKVSWFKDYIDHGGIHTETLSDFSYWSEVRITYDGVSSFLEINFKSTIPVLTVHLDQTVWAGGNILEGNLVNGGGKVIASANFGRLNIAENKFFIDSKGNVGVGTTDTKDFKLGVNGKIAATEVKVAAYANWADFVFKKGYNLPTLIEVEKHIKKKGHLQNIPSAAEVKKDGFFLGEMDAKLLQKIEELTLYTIQQEKDNKKLLSIIEKLEARIAKIENINK